MPKSREIHLDERQLRRAAALLNDGEFVTAVAKLLSISAKTLILRMREGGYGELLDSIDQRTKPKGGSEKGRTTVTKSSPQEIIDLNNRHLSTPQLRISVT